MKRIKILQDNDYIRNLKERIYRNRFELLIFTGYLIYLTILRLIIPTDYVLYSEEEYDWEFYYLMSRDITIIFKKQVVKPFCYRIFYPFLVYLLPFTPLFSFSLISFMSYLIMGIILYYTLRLHLSKVYSAAGLGILCILMVTSQEFVVMPFYIGFTVDPLVYLLFICCFYSILTSNKKMYMIFLIFGILTKESVVLTIPVFFICTFYREQETITFKRFLITFYQNIKYIFPAIFILLLLRLIVIPLPIQDHPHWYEYYMYDDYLSIGFFIAVIQDHLDDPIYLILGCTYLSWSYFIFFLFFNSKKNWMNWFKIYGIFMSCVYLQILIGVHITRIILIGYYPMILFSTLGFKQVIDYIMDNPKQEEIQFFKPLDNKLGLI